MARPKRQRPLYAGGNFLGKLNTAAFGPSAASESFSKAAAWSDQLTAPHLGESEEHWLIVSAFEAFINGEKEFFDALAFLASNKNAKIKDPLRYALIQHFFGIWGQKVEMTALELLDQLAMVELYPDERNLRRICKEIGIKLKPGKRGRRRITD